MHHELVLEFEPGDVRHGRSLVYAYGYLSNTSGLDGEEEDIVLGFDDSSEYALVVNVRDFKSPCGYERKTCLFFSSKDEAHLAIRTMYPAGMIMSETWDKIGNLTFLHGSVILLTIHISDYESQMDDDLYLVEKSEVPRGDTKGGKYAARIQIGVEKDGSPMYRYFQTDGDYKKYLKKVGRSAKAAKHAKDAAEAGEKLARKVKKESKSKDEDTKKSLDLVLDTEEDLLILRLK